MTLSQELRRELAALRAMPDDEIDTSDIPETEDWSRAVRGRFYRPPAMSTREKITAVVRLVLALIVMFLGAVQIGVRLADRMEAHGEMR